MSSFSIMEELSNVRKRTESEEQEGNSWTTRELILCRFNCRAVAATPAGQAMAGLVFSRKFILINNNKTN